VLGRDFQDKSYVSGIFLDEASAKKAAKGIGFYRDGRIEILNEDVVCQVTPSGELTYHVLGLQVEATYVDPSELAAQAVSKLTEQEKKALKTVGWND